MLRHWQTLALAILVPALSACHIGMHMQGSHVSDQDGRLFVDGAPVDFHREVTLQGDLGEIAALRFNVPTGSIDLVGGPGNTFELVVDLYTEFEGDGEVELSGGELQVTSGMDGAVLVNAIRGRLPEGVSLDLRAGTGDIFVTSFVDNTAQLDLESGTGNVQVSSCRVDQLKVECGTGDIRSTDSAAARVQVSMGTGSWAAKGCEFASFFGDSGTGDFLFQACRLDQGRFASGVGDVRLTSTLVSALDCSLGTGQVLTDEQVSEAAPTDG